MGLRWQYLGYVFGPGPLPLTLTLFPRVLCRTCGLPILEAATACQARAAALCSALTRSQFTHHPRLFSCSLQVRCPALPFSLANVLSRLSSPHLGLTSTIPSGYVTGLSRLCTHSHSRPPASVGRGSESVQSIGLTPPSTPPLTSLSLLAFPTYAVMSLLVLT